MKLSLEVWRQKNSQDKGCMVSYEAEASKHMSFLEMLDLLNEQLLKRGEDPIAFDSDCREGICGMCALMINGRAHGPRRSTAVCQLHMREFKDGDKIYLEPWRAKAFPVLKDLIVDRSAFDRIQQAGGYISVNTGSAPDANAIAIGKESADIAMDSASCIGCGACVASCKNASAMLFVSARLGQFAHLPQGQPQRRKRALDMVHAMDKEGFGNCTNQYECEAACPKDISVNFIREMNLEFMKASLLGSRA